MGWWRAVVLLLLIFLQVQSITWKSYSDFHDQRYTRKFYIYDWGEHFWWRWPDSCSVKNYADKSNSYLSGTGEPIDLDAGLFNTWHFSLFNALFNRLRRSKYRTMDPDEASMFIIGYDIALDSYVSHACEYRLKPKCSIHLSLQSRSYIINSPHYLKHQGRDHVLLWSLHQYHAIPGKACGEILRDVCNYCTFTCYWMNATAHNNQYVSVPYPSSYHWHEGIHRLPWSIEHASSRNISVLYLGSAGKTMLWMSTAIRRAIADECIRHPKNCSWLDITHRSDDARVKAYLSAYQRSVFCLQPPGDDAGRRAVFDAIIAGCIPVIFDYNTLYNQYPWHMSEEMALDISIYIPGEEVVDKRITVMDVLSRISADVIRKKQLAISLLAPSLQYSLPPLHQLANLSDSSPWESPFSDAVDRIIDGLFRRTASAVRNKSIDVREIRSRFAWEQDYKDVRIKVPELVGK
jgi:xyloglucan galactosyltransferase MUR3